MEQVGEGGVELKLPVQVESEKLLACTAQNRELSDQTNLVCCWRSTTKSEFIDLHVARTWPPSALLSITAFERKERKRKMQQLKKRKVHQCE